MRYVLDVRYRGTGYSGWQIQPNALTVQEELNKALALILKEPVVTYGAGRTDAGVHAMQMPTHFDYAHELHPHFLKALNAVLPKGISVTRVLRPLREKFHARFDATSRAYRYNIIFQKDPFWFERSWWCKEQINVQAMIEAAPVIMEYGSFESFCKANANNKTFLCQIHESNFSWEGDVLVYRVKANRFLRGMVRCIVGTLFEVAKGRLDADGVRAVIEAKDRRQAGSSVIADGLFLTEVEYPEGYLEEIPFARK